MSTDWSVGIDAVSASWKDAVIASSCTSRTRCVTSAVLVTSRRSMDAAAKSEAGRAAFFRGESSMFLQKKIEEKKEKKRLLGTAREKRRRATQPFASWSGS